MRRIPATVALLGALTMGATGCGYLSDRGDDALDMFDIGITVTDSWVPQFGLYMDYFQFTPIGYSNFDGKLLGIGHSQIGWLDSRMKGWGILTTGVEDIQHGDFDPFDPRQAPPGMERLLDHPPFYTGVLPIRSLGEKGPMLMHAECNRVFHFGWLGFMMSCRPLDWGDFLVGWFGIDYMHDDDWAIERKARKAAEPKPAKRPKPAKVKKPAKAEKETRAERPAKQKKSRGWAKTTESHRGETGAMSETERWRREQMRQQGAYAPEPEQREAPRPVEKKRGNVFVRGFRATVKWMRDVEDWVWNHW